MLSQSNDYPIVTQYDSGHIAVPVDVMEITRNDPEGEPQAGYEYTLLIVAATDMSSQSAYVNTVQALLDAKAQSRGYDGILSACTYATSTNAVFAAEGQACVIWRDSVWTKCYEILSAVQAGIRLPPKITELLDELPILTWP